MTPGRRITFNITEQQIMDMADYVANEAIQTLPDTVAEQTRKHLLDYNVKNVDINLMTEKVRLCVQVFIDQLKETK